MSFGRTISVVIEADSLALLDAFRNELFYSTYDFDESSIRKLFIPNTYEVYWTISPLEFLERMQKEYNRFWSEDRLLPDIIRSLIQKNPILLRYPNAVRPWQHVLEPLSGYLQLSEKLLSEDKSHFQGAFNFGPHSSDFRTVQALVEKSFSHWHCSWKDQSKDDDFHEAGLLNLTTDKARNLIGWFPVWDFSESIERTIDWYRKIYFKSEEPEKICSLQIKEFLDSKYNE